MKNEARRRGQAQTGLETSNPLARYSTNGNLAPSASSIKRACAAERYCFQAASQGLSPTCRKSAGDWHERLFSTRHRRCRRKRFDGAPCGKEGPSRGSRRYSTVVALLNTGWRVIECRDGIQWILQRLAGKRHGQPRWEGRCYCRTRDGLAARVRELAGELDATALAILEGLPDWIGGRP